MTYVAFVMVVVGFIAYLGAFAQGAGPTMGDRPMQAALFSLATILLAGGVLILIL